MSTLQDSFERSRYQRVENDYFSHINTEKWTLVEGDVSASILAASVNGEMFIDINGTDNAEAYYGLKNTPYLFGAGRNWLVEQQVKHTYSANATINWLAGVGNTFAADALVDNAGGYAASATGALFITLDGDANLKVQTHLAGVIQETELTSANTLTKKTYAKQDTNWRLFGVRFRCLPHMTVGKVEYLIDGHVVVEHINVPVSAVKMKVGGGVKVGSSVSVDHFVNLCRESEDRVAV